MRYRHTILLITLLLSAATASAVGPQKDSTLAGMPWQQDVSRDLMTSGAQTITENDLEHVSVSDLRKRMRGLFLSAQVLENCGGLTQSGVMASPFMNSDQISVTSRNFWNLACIIDDVPIPMNQYLFEPNQIESITFITDIADKASYGTIASKGAFIIRTKRGGYDTPLRIRADFEGGVETPDIWPEYVSGEQYAILNNIAREQSGYAPLYSEEAIKGFALNNPYDIKYPSVDYRSLFFRSAKPVSRFGINASAGSGTIKFNTSLGGLYGSDLIKIGPDTYFSKLNLSTSVTARIGQYLEAGMSFNGLVTFAQDGNGGSFYEANTTPPVAFPLILQIDPQSEYYDPSVMESGMTVYGVSKTQADNPYAAQIEGGYSKAKRRSGMFNGTLNFDMSWLLPGLKSKTFINIATFYSATMGKQEEYLAYYWDANNVLDGRSIDHMGTKTSKESVLANSTFQSLNAFERLSYDWSKNGHSISAAATGMLLKASSPLKNTSTKELSAIATIKYSYSDKYVLDLVANYSGTTLFRENKRWGFFPAAGLAWNVEKEDFLKDSSWLTSLKLRAQYGKIGDLDIFSMADNTWESSYEQTSNSYFHYGPRTGTSWIGNLTENMNSASLRRMGNDELTWPVITEADAGFDATLFDKLDVRFNWYKAVQSGVIMNISDEFPTSLGHVNGGGVTTTVIGQYGNHDQYTYKGFELGLGWHQDWEDFGYNINVEGRNWDKINDIITNNFYNEEYQNAAGRPASQWRGYIYDGILTQADIDNNVPLLSQDAKPGDIRYKDVNGDGKVDANDKMFIGGGNAKLRYSINLGLRYKRFDFNLVGTGQAFYETLLSSTYFMGGYSTLNYSAFIWDSLTKDASGRPTAYGDEFPRLTYIYNSNNFECSEYWLRDGGWFKIHSVELGYNAAFRGLDWINAARFSLRATNLLTLTNLKYIDPEANVAGIQAAPLYKSVTLGVKFTF